MASSYHFRPTHQYFCESVDDEEFDEISLTSFFNGVSKMPSLDVIDLSKMSSCDIIELSATNTQRNFLKTPTYDVTIYRQRWLMLFIFSLNTMMNGLLFMSLSPINDVASGYYQVSSTMIEWLSNMFLLTYVVLALPMTYIISKYGVKNIMTLASCLHFASVSMHYYGYNKAKFPLVFIGQCFAAISYSILLQLPGQLSSQWFPASEGATATSIGVFMNLFGVAIGFLQPSIMVGDSNDIIDTKQGFHIFFLSQLVLSGFILVLTLAYKEKPPTIPRVEYLSTEDLTFLDSIKLLWNNKDFCLLSLSYAIYYGLFVTFSVLVNPMCISRFPVGYEILLGWMGFTSDIAAIVACFLIGLILDKYHLHRKTTIGLNLLTAITWFLFTFVLTSYTENFKLIYALFVMVGIFGIPLFASGIEHAAEITHPVSEVLSSTVLLIFGNLYGFIFVYVLGCITETDARLAGYVMVLLYCISTALACLVKSDSKRSLND